MNSSSSSSDLLDDPILWQLFVRRLTGTNAIYDTELVRSFAEAIETSPHRVLDKIKTYCHSGPASRN